MGVLGSSHCVPGEDEGLFGREHALTECTYFDFQTKFDIMTKERHWLCCEQIDVNSADVSYADRKKLHSKCRFSYTHLN